MINRLNTNYINDTCLIEFSLEQIGDMIEQF